MLLKLAKESTFLQNLYIALSCAIHPLIKHNAGKIEVLKSAFWHAAMEKVEGGYFEFGVYEGASMLAALKIHRAIISRATSEFLGMRLERRFYGFDAFEGGFRYHGTEDAHPVFREGEFASSYARCLRRLRHYPEAALVKGYFEETIDGKRPAAIPSGERCAVAFIDCDLKVPARIALEFLAPLLQAGSVVILDDVFSYKGDPAQGVSGAWLEFLEAHPRIKTRPFFPYGCTGMSYVVYAV